MKQYLNPERSKWAQICLRPVTPAHELEALLARVFTDVERDGDKAVKKYMAQFDKVALPTLELTIEELQQRAALVQGDLKNAIDMAYQNIYTFHNAQKQSKKTIETTKGVTCWRESRPIESVGLYVPGGTAPLLSTALMLGVPAQIAGCQEIVLCTPPSKEGSVEPGLCYIALKTGVTKVVRLGGAQAIAAMAIGTQTVPKVAKIFGPGNQYVTGAKLYAQKYGVSIDLPAGPSEASSR